jgi:enoyl-CoA hydratase/carnithine racemase
MNDPAEPVLTTQNLLRLDDDGVAFLTLNRPRQYNALSGAVLAPRFAPAMT